MAASTRIGLGALASPAHERTCREPVCSLHALPAGHPVCGPSVETNGINLAAYTAGFLGCFQAGPGRPALVQSIEAHMGTPPSFGLAKVTVSIGLTTYGLMVDPICRLQRGHLTKAPGCGKLADTPSPGDLDRCCPVTARKTEDEVAEER
jgi:hypothetical protein